MKIRNLVILGICIGVLLCSAGCVTTAKNLLKPIPVPTVIKSMVINKTTNQTIFPIPTILYFENQNEYMFRSGGHYLGDWVQYKRDNVEGLKDIDMRATVYRTLFLPNYYYWSVDWGQYFPQAPAVGMKYLVVFARICMVGADQEKDPRMWGPGQDHFRIQVGNQTFGTENATHVIGNRIKELEEYWDLGNVSRIYDYGYFRYYDGEGIERSGELGYIRMGESNAWDGFLIFEVPANTGMNEIKILERIDGIGNIWWYTQPKPLN